jgi:glycosyltransferase involved in cell wall biosynthesis
MCYFAFMEGTSAGRAFLSVIIPNRNGARTIGKCLDALFDSRHDNFEVIVVDDSSTDDSVEIIKRYPSRLVTLPGHSGASAARNAGAREARGEVLFFIDSDCVVLKDTLDIAVRAYYARPQSVTGGTYSPISHDRKFFSTFQSLFINYSETKHPNPDYVATHAMVISKELFEQSGGFDEDFMPILEDVEFSHRLRRGGVELRMEPTLQVEHIFHYSFWGSLRNAFRKSFYWTMYSMRNRDLFRDSGTASVELKSNVFSWFACVVFLALFLVTGQGALLVALAATCCLNLFVNMNFIRSMARAAGVAFTLGAVLYYTALYPLPVAAGGLLGALRS